MSPRGQVIAHVLSLSFVREIDVVGGSGEANRKHREPGDDKVRPGRSRAVDRIVIVVIVVIYIGAGVPRGALRVRRLARTRLRRIRPLAHILHRLHRMRVRLR